MNLTIVFIPGKLQELHLDVDTITVKDALAELNYTIHDDDVLKTRDGEIDANNLLVDGDRLMISKKVRAEPAFPIPEKSFGDDTVEITINGTQLLLPVGSTVEDALVMIEERSNVGTQDVSPEHVAYIQWLESSLDDHGYRLDVDESQDPPFVVTGILNETKDQEHLFDDTRDIHKFLRQAEANAHETQSALSAV